jgi:hypothetical protein
VAGDVVEALDAAVTWRNPDGDARAHFPSPKPIDAHRHEEEQR